MSNRALRNVLALTIIAFAIGCQKKEDEGTTFSTIYAQTLGKTSGCANCHAPGGSGTNQGAQLDFSTQALAYSTLTSKKVTGSSKSSTCGTVNIVTAGSPSNSYLAGAVVGSHNVNNFAGVSDCQPITDHINGNYASASEQEAIISWIQSGAKNN